MRDSALGEGRIDLSGSTSFDIDKFMPKRAVPLDTQAKISYALRIVAQRRIEGEVMRVVVFGMLALLGVATHAQVSVSWSHRYDGPVNLDIAYAVALDAGGNVFVAGESQGVGTNVDFTLLKLSPSGALLWESRYHGGSGADRARALAVDSSGNAYLTGESIGSTSGFDYATTKFSPSGALLWSKRFTSAGNANDFARAIILDSQGNVIVTGGSHGPPNGTANVTTIKYDSNGNEIWTRTFDGPAGARDEGFAVTVDEFDNVYVAGIGRPALNNDMLLIKYDSAGNLEWSKFYNGPGNGEDGANAVAYRAGYVYITGYSRSAGGNVDYTTIKYSAIDGAQIWVARYDGPATGTDNANAIAIGSDNSVYVTGDSQRMGGGADYATIKYSSAGVEQWVSRYDGSNGNDIARAIVLGSSGEAYITGSSAASNGQPDYATVRYDTNGGLDWVMRYNGPNNTLDEGNSICIDNAGGVYVTGRSVAANADFYTIKYQQDLPPQLELTIQLIGASHSSSFIRGMEIHLGGTQNGSPIYIERNVTFAPNGIGTIVLTSADGVPANNANFTLVSVKDPLHTVRKLAPVSHLGGSSYQASVALFGGDANGDNVIDIVDFALFAAQFGTEWPTPDTPIGAPPPHCDFSADGKAATADYTFFVANFLFIGDGPPGGFLHQPPIPKKAETVKALLREGIQSAPKLDLDRDGWVTFDELTRFLASG